IRRRLDRLRGALLAQLEQPQTRLPLRQALKRRGEPFAAEHSRIDPVGELAEPRDRGPDLALGPDELRVLPARGEAERDRDADEPLLRAVVEVALEPAPLAVRGGHQTGARCTQIGELL